MIDFDESLSDWEFLSQRRDNLEICIPKKKPSGTVVSAGTIFQHRCMSSWHMERKVVFTYDFICYKHSHRINVWYSYPHLAQHQLTVLREIYHAWILCDQLHVCLNTFFFSRGKASGNVTRLILGCMFSPTQATPSLGIGCCQPGWEASHIVNYVLKKKHLSSRLHTQLKIWRRFVYQFYNVKLFSLHVGTLFP